jgi:hypothetical protein
LSFWLFFVKLKTLSYSFYSFILLLTTLLVAFKHISSYPLSLRVYAMALCFSYWVIKNLLGDEFSESLKHIVLCLETYLLADFLLLLKLPVLFLFGVLLVLFFLMYFIASWC